MYILYSAIKDNGSISDISVELHAELDKCRIFMELMGKIILDGCRNTINKNFKILRRDADEIEVYCKRHGGTLLWIEKANSPELN